MDDITALKEAEKQQTDVTEPCARQNWTFPVMLILFGTIFLLSNLGYMALSNWWALFFLFPVVGSLEKAWHRWQARGRVTRYVRRHLVGAVIWGLVGMVFLFGLSWAYIWPLLIIVWGVSLLFQGVQEA